MPNFDADIKRQERQRNVALWETQADKAAGKTDSVKQPEQKRYEPDVAKRQLVSPRKERTTSTPTNRIDKAIAASTGAAGTWT